MTARRVIVAVWLLALAACGLAIVRAPFLTDMSVFLPARPTPEQQMLADNLTSGVVSRLLLVGVDGVPPERQGDFSRALARRLRDDPRFETVSHGDPADFEADQRFVLGHRYLLSPAVTPAHFETPALRAALQQAIADLSSSAGLATKHLLARDPTGEVLRLTGSLTQAGNGPAMRDGVWTSRDGTRLTLLVHTRASGGDLDGQEQAIAAVREKVADTARELAVPGATPVLSGPGVFAVDSRESIRADVTRLSTLGSGLILLLMVVVFRSLPAVALTLVPMFTAVAAGAATVVLAFGNLHGLTLGFGATLIGEAVDYALYHLIRAGSPHPVPAGAFWATIRLGAATSAIGFLSLLFSGFPGLAQMAVFSVSGLLAAALTTQYLLPVLTPAGFRTRDFGPFDRRLTALIGPLRTARWPAAALTAAALIALVVQRDHLWDSDIASLNPVSVAAQQLDEVLREAAGAPATAAFVVIPAPTTDAALEAAERIAARLDPLVAAGTLAGYESPARWWPSAATQQRRREALPPPEVLRERLREATVELPLRAERLEPFVADVAEARTGAPIERAELAGTQLGLQVESLITRYRGEPAVLMPLHAPPGQWLDAAAVRAALGTTANGDPPLLLQPKAETDRLYDGYLREVAWLSLGGTAAIALLLAATIRPLARVPAVFAPLAGAVVLTMAGFVLAGRPMNLLHLIGLLLVVAVGSNYALFFHSLRDGVLSERASGGTMTALFLANVTSVIGFGVLAGSQVPLLSALGLTVTVGSVLALLLSCLWIGVGPAGGLMRPARRPVGRCRCGRCR